MRPRRPRARTLWLLAGVQAAVWSTDYVVRRVRRRFRITEGRFHP